MVDDTRVDDKGEMIPIQAIVLVHMNGTTEREVDNVRFGGRVYEPQVLADRFRGKAESYAQDLMGAQTFCLIAFYQISIVMRGGIVETGEKDIRFPFAVQGDSGIEPSLGTYGPDPKGEKMQGMAITQGFVGLAMAQSRALFEAQQRQLTLISGQNEMLATKLAEANDIAMEMIMKMQDKQHEYRLKEISAGKSAALQKSLLTMAPALINQFSGQQVFPQATADSALVETLLDKLLQMPEEHVPMVIQQLGLDAQSHAAVMMRLKVHAEKRSQEIEEAESLVAENPETPIDDDESPVVTAPAAKGKGAKK